MADKNQKIFDRFGIDVNWMILHAKAASINAEADCVYPESFVIGILTTGENAVSTLLLKHNADLEKCLKIFKERLALKKADNKSEEGTPYENLKISKQVIDVCKMADVHSTQLKHDFIGVQHIFSALLSLCPDIRDVFVKEKVKMDVLLKELREDPAIINNPKDKTETTQSSHAILDSLCTNMTEMAAEGKYDPIISREAEIEEAITVLCRRDKSNPIFVGEAGTGKTAIVQGIAQRIISNTVPKKIRGCKIYSLNVASLVAGTKYRGEFEQRMQGLLKELEADSSCILFIDEIHTIVGAGSAQGTLDASNILKPSLARNLKCIGATTSEEYKKYFAGEGALERRFEKIDVDPPTVEQTKKILMGIKHKFEEYHKCTIPVDTIDAIISLTERYKPTKNFPDKAIDCMDYACAKCVWEEVNDGVPVITPNDIAIVISKQCKIPIEVILWSNFERITNIEHNLKSKVVGQGFALENICRLLKKAYSGVRDRSKPIGVFVFGGESGTGKTYTAKQMAKAIDFNLIRLDMTEYLEEHSVSKIIGSPPGYVGFKEVDVVADKIRRRPYSLLLLDEIEKAHPNVMKIFLQIMGEGMLTDAMGNKVDCKNLIIIMTGNFGLNDKKSGLGFSNGELNEVKNEQKRLQVFCAQRFGDEFINRVDEFIPFIHLNDSQLNMIAILRMEEFIKRVVRKNCVISFSDDVPSLIVKLSKEEHGKNANILERIISKKIESKLADMLLNLDDGFKGIYKVNISVEDDDFVVTKEEELQPPSVEDEKVKKKIAKKK